MKSYLFLILSLIGVAFSWPVFGQTMGLIQQSEFSYNGYTLLFPSASRSVFLIDNCGKLVHQWNTNYSPGLSTYLMENGDIIRTERISSPFPGGGSGGRIERINWDGDVQWATNFSTSTYHQHHDVEVLPNGNILVIAWEDIPEDSIALAGRESLSGFGFWSCLIAEIEPSGTFGAEIVWQWRAADHLIQDVDSSLANFGVISEHPERIDVNLSPGASPDWLHVNGIDYNAELDQIILSVHDVHEIWIIDHSTTTAEAKSSSGGRSGKGGDLLYRWGNPQNYGMGNTADQKLFGQHDAQWIEPGSPDAGAILVFNNGQNQPGPQRSTVLLWHTPLDTSGHYVRSTNEPFGPSEVDWKVGEGAVNFYSSRISGAQRLPNGNTLICVGREGQIIEVDSNGQKVWEYINPVSTFIHMQGDNPSGNDLFRAYRYGSDFPAFEDRVLFPGDPIELDPLDYECEIYLDVVGVEEPLSGANLFPNPATSSLTIESAQQDWNTCLVIDAMGQVVEKVAFQKNVNLDISNYSDGMYFCNFIGKKSITKTIKKFIVTR